MLALHFKVKFDHLFVQRVFGHDGLQTRELWGSFAEVREKSVLGFWNYWADIFCKNAVLNICRYLKRFFTFKKINNNFLEFDHTLLRMPRILEIGQIFPAEKRDSKT